MHLKTLTLRGFKSFASATTLNFEPGVTCVVGPNGSGKSNVVDALAWVMGEQGAKSLRGGKMEDVIFAGTSGRPPLGRAEVSLTIDNTDGALPIEYTEVTISRTLFRNGGSEYAINGQGCRLLDIQDLLSDSGLGREMHVIVGQGQLDAVLRATPEERRGFIEEAAGVLKHRKRKEKALRKLDAMQANLTRLGDLTGEIRRQLGPLGRQAEVARKAAVVQTDLRDARARLLADDLAQLTAQLEQEIADETALTAQRAEVEAVLTQTRARLATLEREAAEAAPALSEASEVWYRLSSLRERLRGTSSLAADRVRLLGVAAPERPPGRLRPRRPRRAGRARARRPRPSSRPRSTSPAPGSRAPSSARQQAEQESAAAEKELATSLRGAADRREGVARLAGQVAARRSRVEATQAELGRLRESLVAAQTRGTEATTQFAALESQVAGRRGGRGGARRRARGRARGPRDRDRPGQRPDRAARRRRARAHGARVPRRDARAEPDPQGRRGCAARGRRRQRHHRHGRGPARGRPARRGGRRGRARRDRRRRRGGVGRGGGRRDPLPAHRGRRARVAAGRRLDRRARGSRTESTARSGRSTSCRRPSTSAARSPSCSTASSSSTTSPRRARCSPPTPTSSSRPARGDVLSRHHASGGSATAPSALHLQAALDQARQRRGRRRPRPPSGCGSSSPRATTAQAAADDAHEATLERLNESDAALAAVAEQLGHLGSTARAARAEAERVEASLEVASRTLEQDTADLAELTERLAAAEVEPAESEAAILEGTARRDRLAELATGARSRETEARLTLRTVEERARALAGRAESLERAARTERVAREKAAERERARARQVVVAQAVRIGADRALGVPGRVAAACVRRA